MSNTILKTLLVVAFISIKLNCFGQIYSQSDFVQIPTPAPESKEWHEFNLSVRTPIKVLLVKGQLQLSKNPREDYIKYKLPYGELVALDMGEFGGGLYYKPDNDTGDEVFQINGKIVTLNNEMSNYGWMFSKDSPEHDLIKGMHVLIHGGNVNSIFTYKDSTYFIDGLAHMATNKGSLYKIEYHKNSFSIIKMLDFDDAPRSVAVYNDTIFIATFKKFYIITDWKKELVFDNLFWYGFNPSSIVVKDNKNIYLGMVGFYAKIDLEKRDLVLYKYNK